MTRKIDLGAALRDALPTHTAPDALREWARSRAQNELEDVSESDASQHEATHVRPRPAPWSISRVLYAASLLVVGALGWEAHTMYQHAESSSRAQTAMVAELVDTHVRSLMAEHLTDVRSTDQHTVKPWFAGKIDFAPPVSDLAAQGFPLLGGRVEYVHGHAAAALVYGRRRHIVNLLIWPATPTDAGTESVQYNGYALLHWVRGSLSYWAVSDAAPSELIAFRAAYLAGS